MTPFSSSLRPSVRFFISVSGLFLLSFTARSQQPFPFVCTPLTGNTDFSAKMVAGVDSFLTRETERAKEMRPGLWKRDFSSGSAFQKSISVQKDFLARRVGVVEDRVSPQMQILTNLHAGGLKPFKIESAHCIISAVRWQVYGRI